MIFNSAQFAIFFFVFFFCYFLISSNRRTRLWILSLGSILFYGSWNWRFIPFLLGTGIIDFYIARYIVKQSDRKNARRLLTASIVLNVGVLAIFKYLNFFLASVTQGAHELGIGFVAPILHLTVPLGISFYTFQSMSYTIDVYRGTFQPKTDLLDFIASLTFFPHLLAGPIVRSSFLLPQFESLSSPTRASVERGLLILTVGLVKKTLADELAPFADSAYAAASHGLVSTLDAWTGALAFTGQIYADFSGYTDMAMGLAMLLGFTLPPNFELPYLSASPNEFWNRWHISLTSWFRDYLYFSLALGPLKKRPYTNLFTVLVIAGLWHGAGWNFLGFGVYHGAVLAATQRVATRRKKRLGASKSRTRVLAIAATFYFIVIGHVIFRANTWAAIGHMLGGMHALGTRSHFSYVASLALLFVVATVIYCHAMDYLLIRRNGGVKRTTAVALVVVLGTTFALMFGSNAQSFIYFQF